MLEKKIFLKYKFIFIYKFFFAHKNIHSKTLSFLEQNHRLFSFLKIRVVFGEKLGRLTGATDPLPTTLH